MRMKRTGQGDCPVFIIIYCSCPPGKIDKGIHLDIEWERKELW